MPNTTITVKAIGEPRGSGPGSAKGADEKWFKYWTDKITLAKGVTYEVETYDKTRDGKTDTFIGKVVKEVRAAPATNGHAPGGFDDRGGVPPHVSNWVAHAIQAGMIKTPKDLCSWAQWSYQAGIGMTQRPATMPPAQQDRQIDDEVPY